MDAPLTVPGRLHSRTLVSIVIPCFNEESVLPMLFERIQTVTRAWPYASEIIVVDDGSTDRTWELLQSFHQLDPRWKIVKLSRNFGHQLALWTGLHKTQGDVVAVLDGDLQDPPEVLSQFLQRWSEGYDVVFAVRRKRKENWLKRTAYFLYYRLLGLLSEFRIPLDSGDFCVMDRKVIHALAQCKEQEPFIRGLRAWVGFPQAGLEYERAARQAGEAKYTFRKLMALGLNGIFSFSTRPLKLATYSGVAISCLAFVGVLFTIAQRIFAPEFAQMGIGRVPGVATITICVLFLGGIQLICLGILGEYIGRIFLEVKGRPLTFVLDSKGFVEELTIPLEARATTVRQRIIEAERNVA